ncbi:MAG: response regulator [Thermoplasmata archaeon]
MIDDDPLARKLVSLILHRAGYEVALAADAFEAERELTPSPPDLILMDLNLPGKDGCTFTQELRHRSETADIPIVAVTAFTVGWDEKAARKAGCNDYLPKPINDAILGRTLRLWLTASPSKGTTGSPGPRT